MKINTLLGTSNADAWKRITRTLFSRKCSRCGRLIVGAGALEGKCHHCKGLCHTSNSDECLRRSPPYYLVVIDEESV